MGGYIGINCEEELNVGNGNRMRITGDGFAVFSLEKAKNGSQNLDQDFNSKDLASMNPKSLLIQFDILSNRRNDCILYFQPFYSTIESATVQFTSNELALHHGSVNTQSD